MHAGADCILSLMTLHVQLKVPLIRCYLLLFFKYLAILYLIFYFALMKDTLFLYSVNVDHEKVSAHIIAPLKSKIELRF